MSDYLSDEQLAYFEANWPGAWVPRLVAEVRERRAAEERVRDACDNWMSGRGTHDDGYIAANDVLAALGGDQ